MVFWPAYQFSLGLSSMCYLYPSYEGYPIAFVYSCYMFVYVSCFGLAVSTCQVIS